MSQTIAQTLLIAGILSQSLAADSVINPYNCIQSQRPCLIDRSCGPALLEKIPKLCGPTDNQHCFSNNQPACRDSLVRLKSTPELQSSCYCQNPSSRSCQDYYNLLYNHPCLRFPPAPNYPPSAQTYDFDLEFAGQLLMNRHVLLSCTSALHACRKSPLCRRVYDEFRRRCKIKDNRCRMTNAALCYNSYELIKLTPLWKCICDRPSEKRCLRVQKSIVGNPCIGGMPDLYGSEDDADDSNATNSRVQGSTVPVIRRTTPVRSWSPRPITPSPSRHRATVAPPARKISTTTTLEPGDVLEEETEAPPSEELPNESTEPEAAAISETFPGPDEDFDLIPHIAASLLYPIAEKIKEILVVHYEMVTLPPPVTEAPVEVEVEEEYPETTLNGTDQADGETAEVVQVAQTLRTTTPPVGRTRTTVAVRTSPTVVSRTSSSAPPSGSIILTSTPSSTRFFRRRTTVSTQTSTFSSTHRTEKVTVTVAPPVTEITQEEPEEVSSTDVDPDYSPDYPTAYSTGELSTTTELAETEATTIFIDYSIPDPRILPSGMCWRQIREWRENFEFDDAVVQFHNSCRWMTDNNDTCDATSCLDAEARLQRWMGDLFPYCRNLTCGDSLPQCGELISFLSPGCVKDAFFLEDVETETITCRDFKRNGLVLTVPRYSHKRIFASEYCSDMCTCDMAGKVKCDRLPCMESKVCQGNYATFPPGAPGYRAFQGPCLCYMSKMLCVRPYNYTLSKGVWLFMAYSQEEEQILLPWTNLTIDRDVITRMRRLPYSLKREEPCLFHLEPSEPDYVILRSDEFEFDNSTADRGSDGTRLNEEYCDKFFRWIVNEVTNKKSTHQDLLLSVIKLAEVEWNKRIGSTAAPKLTSKIDTFVILMISSILSFYFSMFQKIAC